MRQHRHDTVGKVNGIAALQRLAVERAVRSDVVRHVGDGDQQVPAAGIAGIVVRFGPDRVVEVAGVFAVDGDQRYRTQIDPAGQRRRTGGLRLRQRFGRELVGDVVVVDGDQGNRSWPHRGTETFGDARLLQPERPARLHLRPHQLARRRPHRRLRRQ